MQSVTLALPTVRIKAEDKLIGLAATRPETMHQKESYIFLKATATAMTHSGRSCEVTVLISEPLKFPIESPDTAFKAKEAYKLRFSYRISVSIMHLPNCRHNTGAGANHICLSMTPRGWTSHIKREMYRKYEEWPNRCCRLTDWSIFISA